MGEIKETTAEELKASKAENKKLVAELKAANQAAEKNAKLVEELNTKLADSESNQGTSEEVEKLKNELKAKDELIKSLNDKLAEKEKENDDLGGYPVFTFKGKKYELVDAKSRARVNGKSVVITKDSLSEDSKLLQHCIEKGYGCLRLKGGK